MQTFGAFIVSLLSASMALGHVIPESPKSSFEVTQVRNAKFNGRSGPLALAQAYKKFGKPVPKYLQQAIAKQGASTHSKRVHGSATAQSIQGDLEYNVAVQIGTPAQTLNLDFDTGSSDLWVFSSETDSSSANGHSIYTPSLSSTSTQLSGASWSISYGDGSSSSGDVYTDVVTVGNLSVQKQAVESAKQVSQQFSQGQSDGLLGLAFSAINTVSPSKQKTWFDSIKGELDAGLFVADLRHNAPGSYVFGAIPSGANNVLYTSVDNSQGFWGFTATVNSESISGIADTGTTLLLLPDDIVSAYYSNVSGATNDQQQGGYVFSCSATLPDFSFNVGGGTITIPGAYINYAKQNGVCFGGLQSSNGVGTNIFGDVALKAAYVVFDDANGRVGWAQKV